MTKMNIATFEDFVVKVKKVLDCLPAFCDSIKFENFKTTRQEGDDKVDKNLDSLLAEIQIVKISANVSQAALEKGKLSKKQVLGYLYKTCIRHRKNVNINVTHRTRTIFCRI